MKDTRVCYNQEKANHVHELSSISAARATRCTPYTTVARAGWRRRTCVQSGAP